METWKPVLGFEGLYEVSDKGRVKNIKTQKIKSPTKTKTDKRHFMLLWKDGKYKAIRVHRIVLMSFVGLPPHGYECCHNDGNPENNCLENLRWDTPANNQADRVKHGTSNRGERCATSKLTEKQVIAIRDDPRKQSIIAKDYGVMPNLISRIKSRTRWGWL